MWLLPFAPLAFVLSLVLGFVFNLLLALLHVLAELVDRHWHDFLVGEHEVYAFQFHRDLFIVAEVGMNIAIDVLLLLKDGIVPGYEEQKSDTNQPDRPSNCLEEPSYMLVKIDTQTTFVKQSVLYIKQLERYKNLSP